jgi:hypothetical protein
VNVQGCKVRKRVHEKGLLLFNWVTGNRGPSWAIKLCPCPVAEARDSEHLSEVSVVLAWETRPRAPANRLFAPLAVATADNS